MIGAELRLISENEKGKLKPSIYFLVSLNGFSNLRLENSLESHEVDVKHGERLKRGVEGSRL